VPPSPQQTGIDGVETTAEAASRTDEPSKSTQADATAPAITATGTAQPWPATLPEQMRGAAQLLATRPAPLPLAAMEAKLKGKGPWKQGLPRILETLEALGRAQQQGGGWRG
jgi:hypothetical protein